MALVVTVTDHWSDTKRIQAVGSVTPSGSYSTGGDTMALGSTAIKSSSIPSYVDMGGSGGYLYSYVKGTTINNGKMKIVVSSTGLELAAGAYPAGVTSDSIGFHAFFPKLI
jgi:hypothetical protein